MAQEKITNAAWDREDAGILRDNALRAINAVGSPASACMPLYILTFSSPHTSL